MSGSDEGGEPARVPSAMYTTLVGVPTVRQYGRRLLAMPARYCALTAHAARPASLGTYVPRRPDKRMAGGERDAAGCSP